MEKQNSNGFKFYPGKYHSPFTSINLINQSFPEANYFPKSLGQVEESSRNEKPSTKTKIIEKAKDKDKEDVKRYDRGGNCVASNTSKLFIKILNKRLSRFPVIQKYLNFYEIYSQKQNILLIPLCLYSFLKQYQHSLHNRFHSDLQIAQKKLFNTQQKFNTRQIYTDIISELKDHIECSLQNSRAKYKDCSDSKKQFHLKNISIYNKISQIIKKVQQLTFGLDDNPQHRKLQAQRQKPISFTQRAQLQKSSSSRQLSSDIKIQQQQLHYNQVTDPPSQKKQQSSSSHNFKRKPPGAYNLESFQSPLQSLYERKQRQYQKAMDKVFSVIMNEKPLRQLFHIYKLDIEEILIESVNYCYRRNINSRVKKNEKIIKDIYQRLENEMVQALDIGDEGQKQYALRGWEFIISFLTLQVAGDKKAEIYDQFKENIKRKTKYFNQMHNTASNDPKQQFDSYYYSYSLRILEEHYLSESKRKKQLDKENVLELHQKLKEWMIGYYYHNTLNRICFEQPRLTPKMSLENQHQQEHPSLQLLTGSTHMNSGMPTTMAANHVEVIKVEQPEILIPINVQESRQNAFFGDKEQRALERLMAEFENLSKQNYENFY